MARFRAGPRRRVQARPHAGDRRRPRRRGGHPQPARAGPPAGRRPGRGARHDRGAVASVGGRPDRRHEELRARRAGVGDPHRPRRGRAAGRGSRRGPGAEPPLVGGVRLGLLVRALALERPPHRVSQVARLADASFSYSSLSSWRAAAVTTSSSRSPTPAGAPGVRRLLVLRPARRGRRRHRCRAGARRARHGRPRARSSPRPGAGSPGSTARPAAGAATPWPPTASCTRRCSRGSAPARGGAPTRGRPRGRPRR